MINSYFIDYDFISLDISVPPPTITNLVDTMMAPMGTTDLNAFRPGPNIDVY